MNFKNFLIDQNIQEKIQILQHNIGYTFKNQELLFEALSHPSIKQYDNTCKNYERFELLGDTILNFIATEILFYKFEDYTEGQIAKIRSYIVSREILYKLAQNIRLDDAIIMAQGEEALGGRNNPSNLENTMEALIAAIYLDSDIKVVKNVIGQLFNPFIDNIDYSIIDTKTQLQELAQRKRLKLIYELVKKTGPDHAPIFKVLVKLGEIVTYGEGTSLKSAEKQAALHLLQIINPVVKTE